MSEKIQMNVRIDRDVRRAHKVISTLADQSFDATTESALRFFFRSQDESVLSLMEMVLSAAKEFRSGWKLPFWWPTHPRIRLRLFLNNPRKSGVMKIVELLCGHTIKM